jgi:hypothetical protein
MKGKKVFLEFTFDTCLTSYHCHLSISPRPFINCQLAAVSFLIVVYSTINM